MINKTVVAVALAALAAPAYSFDTFVTAGMKRWQPDPFFEWGLQFETEQDTRSPVLGISLRDKWWAVDATYLGRNREHVKGTLNGYPLERHTDTHGAMLNAAFTPGYGPVYLRLGMLLGYYVNKEHGVENGMQYDQRTTQSHISGERGIGVRGDTWFLELKYMNSIYTRQSSVGPEYRQFYLVQAGYKF